MQPVAILEAIIGFALLACSIAFTRILKQGIGRKTLSSDSFLILSSTIAVLMIGGIIMIGMALLW